MPEKLVEPISALGGKARADALSPENRSMIAREAAAARWNGLLPKAKHSGKLVIAASEISCAVLETGKRLLTQETFLTSIGRAGKAKAGTGSFAISGLPPFLVAENLQPFVSDDLKQLATPIFFRNEKNTRAAGYEAKLLPLVCEVYLKLRDMYNARGEKIPANQRHIVDACDILMRGLAQVGIIALVDEATGYQEFRAKDELSRILEAYIVEELRPWLKTFPDEFFKQIYRLHGWEYKGGTSHRPQYVGKLINRLVYEQLPSPVLPSLREMNPVNEKGNRRHKHFQYLTSDTGNTHLDRQIASVTMLMRISESKDVFEEHFKKAFASSYQERLPLVVSVPAVGVASKQ